MHKDFSSSVGDLGDVTADGALKNQLDNFCHILNESVYNFCHGLGFCILQAEQGNQHVC